MESFITHIYFNKINSYKNLGLGIYEMPNIPIANEITDNINGYIIKSGIYNDIEVPITFKLENFKSLIKIQDDIINWLKNINDNKLVFSFMSDKYYIVKDVNIENITRDFNAYNTFSATFTLEPFKYDRHDRKHSFTAPSKIKYSGTVKGEPNIKIYGNGNIQLTINNKTIQINNVNEYVELDSKLLLCLNKDGSSKSRDMIGDFPLLDFGINNISWTGNITKVELLKRTAYL